jgi:hypothetical protein
VTAGYFFGSGSASTTQGQLRVSENFVAAFLMTVIFMGVSPGVMNGQARSWLMPARLAQVLDSNVDEPGAQGALLLRGGDGLFVLHGCFLG